MTELSPLARHLIEECKKNKSKSLDLGMCGLTHWPLEVCELHWLEELNFCNYSEQEAEEGDYSNFGEIKHIQHNETYRGKYILIRNHITQLPERSALKKISKLKKLVIGGGLNPIIETTEHWDLTDIDSLDTLVELTEVRLSYTKVSDLSPISQLKGLQSLDLSRNTRISDLSPISQRTGLKSLNLENTRVSDFSPISQLKGLKSLNLENTRISDLSPIAQLKGLKSLNLENTGISDLSPIAQLKGLKSLNLGSIGISDLSPIAQLKGLHSLNLGITGVSDLSPIAQLKGLKSLILRGTGVSDLSPIAQLKGLQTLDLLGNTGVSDLSPISQLNGLLSLNLGNTGVSDLSPISQLNGLKSLDLSGNTGVSDLSPIAQLKGLHSLNPSWNTRVSDFSPIAQLKGLKSLNLERTKVSDLSPIAQLKGLHSLNLGITGVSDLSPIAQLKGMQSLNLWETGVSDLLPISQLTGLQSLSLGNTRVSDISPIAQLKGLKSLNLERTKVSDLSPIAQLKGMQSLDLGNTSISDLSPIAQLKGLQSLHLGGTEVTNLLPLEALLRQPQMRVVWRNDYRGGIVLEGTHIPKSTVELGIEALLRDMESHEDLGAEYKPNKEVKLVVLGNSTAGKTSLLTYLKTEAKQRDRIKWETICTTHGLQTAVWEPDIPLHREKETLTGIKVRILDFGGQEYYHDCHHLFFTHNTAYAVLWEKETNQNAQAWTKQKYSGGIEKKELIEHYALDYWLDAIRFFVSNKLSESDYKTEIKKIIGLFGVDKIDRFKKAQRGESTEEWNEDKIRDEVSEKVWAVVRTKGIDYQRIYQALHPYMVFSSTRHLAQYQIFKMIQAYGFENVNALVIQNKIGEAHQEAFLDQESLVEQFPFITDFAKVDVRKGIAMEHLEAFHFKRLLEEMPILGETYLDFYPEIDVALELQVEVNEEHQQAGKPLFIRQKAFEKTFKTIVSPKFKEHVPEDERPEKLVAWGQNYLQNRFDTGKLLWYPESENEHLKQLIITRPYDMINRFYAILNRDLEKQDSPGRFTLKEACDQVRKAHYPNSKRITKAIEEETQVMLKLMQQFHIVFHMRVADKSFYVAPQYLPVSAHKSKHFLDPIFNKGTHRYHYKGFFHKSVTLAFFSEYGKHAASAHEEPVNENDFMIWRNGLLVKKDGHMVMVEFNPREHCTLLKPQDGDPQNPLLQEMKAHFEKIHTGRHVDLEVSLDGRHFVSLAALEAKAEANPPVLFYETEGRLHKVAEYSHFFSPETQKKFMRKKLFISYSSKDREMIEEFKSQLAVMKRNGEVESWDDHQILPGAKWDEEIEKQMRAADIIVLMISSDFINSDYIWHKEVPLAFDMEKEGKRVVPIILRHCDWTSLNSPIKDNNSVAKGRPIKSYPDRDEGWLHVVRGLRSVINGGGVNDNFKASE